MKINLKSLPKKIYNQFPHSIRSYKDEYELQELPFDLQDLIEEYIVNNKTLSKRETIYDAQSLISQYGDFITISNKKALVIEYLNNFLSIGPRAYPFDAKFYCDIKKHLQTKDTVMRQKLIGDEVANIIRTVSKDLDVDIKIIELSVKDSSFKVRLKIDGEEKSMTVTSPE